MKKLVFVLGIILGYTAMSYADGSGSAVTVVAPDAGVGSAVAVGSGAGTVVPPALPDPLDHPGDALNSAKSDLSTYGYVWGGAIILLGIVAALKKRNDDSHWIHNSYALAGLVAVPTILAALLTWHFAGGSVWPMLMTIGAALAALYQNPKPAGA